MLSKLKAHIRTKRFWLIFLGVFLVTSLVINVVALLGIRSLVDPPAKGQYHDLLQKPPLTNPLNSTGTLFENTVDKLSGGMVSVLIFPKESNFCNDSKKSTLEVAACVDRFKATFIAVTEGVVRNWEDNYMAAQEAGLPDEAEKINQWERHLAAHEFAHVLQYNYREKTVPFENKYFGGDDNYLPLSYEAMAECYAQILYPVNDAKASKPKDFTTVNFYNFPAEERFGLCTEEQQNGIKEWLQAINYPLEGRWDGNGAE